MQKKSRYILVNEKNIEYIRGKFSHAFVKSYRWVIYRREPFQLTTKLEMRQSAQNPPIKL